MADMRLIVAGAGGRMGRTLIQAIAAMPGVALAGAIEAAGAAVIGRDSGELAGLGQNGIPVTSDLAPLLAKADGAHRLHRAGRDPRVRRSSLRGRRSSTSSAPPASPPRTRRLIAQAAQRAPIVKSGNMSLGVNLLAALVKRVAKTLDRGLRHRDPGDASPQQGRRALGHRAYARRGRGRRPRHRPCQALRARPRRPYRAAPCRRYRLCGAARRHRGGRPQRDLCRRRRAHRACRTRPRTA